MIKYLSVILIECFPKSVLRRRQHDAQFRCGICLQLVEERGHLLRVQLRCGHVDLLHPLTDSHRPHQELLAVIHVHLIPRCARLPLDAGQPHPHEVVLGDAPLLGHLLDRDGVCPVL